MRILSLSLLSSRLRLRSRAFNMDFRRRPEPGTLLAEDEELEQGGGGVCACDDDCESAGAQLTWLAGWWRDMGSSSCSQSSSPVGFVCGSWSWRSGCCWG